MNISPTVYKNVNAVLDFIVQGVRNMLADELIGLYLAGSLSYAAFEERRSDIDLVAVLKQPPTSAMVELLREFHLNAEQQFPKWAKRIECSYIWLDLLPSTLPPKTPRPYIGNGIFYPEAPYGNEWLINQYLLYQHGIPLVGPDFKTLVEPIDIADVQEASLRDLHEEWQPKLSDPAYLADSHQQSYLVLNLCRILYTAKCNDLVSKTAAATWVQSEYPQWKELIQAADEWQYGMSMHRADEVVEFIRFVLSEVPLAS